MRYGEFHRFLTDYGRRQVWIMRQSGMGWDLIGEELAITADQVRAWYLRWSDSRERGYQERFGETKVDATLTASALTLHGPYSDQTGPDEPSGS